MLIGVDFWINWPEANDSIESNLEHWGIRGPADRCSGESSVTAVEAALRTTGDIEKRIEELPPSLKGRASPIQMC